MGTQEYRTIESQINIYIIKKYIYIDLPIRNPGTAVPGIGFRLEFSFQKECVQH